MNNSAAHRLSTRLGFLTAGITMAAWAPLVPYAKERLNLEASQLGMLLLCLGIGSLLAMPVTGTLTSRFGCRPVVLVSGALVCAVLPFLAIAPTPLLLGVTLFLFGATIGTLDVAINVQAVQVEKESGRALMSGFHGMFSVGGIAGAGGMALLLWAGMDTLMAAVLTAAVAAAVLAVAAPKLLPADPAAHADAGGSEDKRLFVAPRGAVVVIGLLCFACFMAEGAVLDWSALLLTTGVGASADQGGLGYAAFAVAMTLGRFSGDKIVARFGGQRVLLAGGLCAAAGFFTAVLAPSPAAALLGFVLVGLGASNIVPILFTAAGRQRDMPAGLAVGAITTIGYAGILAGPALIGFIAHASSLQAAFAGLGCAMLLVAASSRSRIAA
ncbi:MFS transporter [Pseudoduganella aquatica]|uniref:MFS transporter n=1 Tax=Pseudoduganella aquatica TaxID=2660641 RepID=A0A7X4KLZ8_9BURK|nr:MFS transporter [Pseudoduganella aquatica]MYN08739.1 MFS transporter [Pseudoduganella aquatica]